MSERLQGDRLVVTGTSSGSQFPRKQEAMAQRYEADGNTSAGPFYVEGSIYGQDLRFRGPGAVLGPVLGRGDVSLEPTYGKSPQRFLGGLHASGNIGTAPRRNGFLGSLLASLDNVGTLVCGDVIADQISLCDTVVFGNVRARRIKLSRCIVFGNVLASETAVIGSSTVLGYDAGREVRFEGPCSMVFPVGTSIDTPAFVPATDETGLELPCAVMFLPALRAYGSSALTFRPGLPAGAGANGWKSTASELSEGDAAIIASALHPVDWVRHPVQNEVRRYKGRQLIVEVVPSERHILSLGGRALNFEAIIPALHHATWMLKTAIEFSHYSTLNQRRTMEAWVGRCSIDEQKLLVWATARENLEASA